MKVLVLTGSYKPEVGGIAEMISGFAAALIQNGLQVHILAATPEASRFSNSACPITEFRLPESGYWSRVYSCRRAVSQLLRQGNFDRIIASSWSPFAVALPGQANGQRVGLDILCYGMDLLEPSALLRYRLLMRQTLRRADKVLAVSQYTATLARALGARSEAVSVMHPGVDAALFAPGKPDPELLARYQIALDAPLLLSVGRLIERKGFDTLIRALPLVLRRHPSAVCLIVGDGPDHPRLSRLANDTGVAANVRFVGNIPMTERVAHYQLVKVFVMPNRPVPEKRDVEGFGIVFLEAACCEVPSIGGNSGGVPDAIEDGVTGFLIDPSSPRDCAERICLLLSDEETRKKMGKAARERAKAHFNWRVLASAYISQVVGHS